MHRLKALFAQIPILIEVITLQYNYSQQRQRKMGCGCLSQSDPTIYQLGPMDVLQNRLFAMVGSSFQSKFKILDDPQYGLLLKLLNYIPESLFVKFMERVNFAIFYHDPCCNFDPAKNFKNWGETFQTIYNQILYPTDKKASSGEQISVIQDFVVNKVAQGKKIRGAGIRHSWGNVFADLDQCLVSFYPYKVAKGTSRVLQDYAQQMVAVNAAMNYKNKEFLCTIKKVAEITNPKDSTKKIHLIKIGAGVSNDQMRRWCIKNGYQYKSNVIMVEVNVCGGLGTCSHGAGIDTQTLADYIYEIEFIDYTGQRRTISKEKHPLLIKSAASALGLLGLVIFITMEMEELQIIQTLPRKTYKDFVIPWPKDDCKSRLQRVRSQQWALFLDIPQNRKNGKERSKVQKTKETKSALTEKYWGQSTWKAAWEENMAKFKEAIHKTYCEWFYFPTEKVHVFENVWQEVGPKTDDNVKKVQKNGTFIDDYPQPYVKFLSQFSLFAGNQLANHTLTHSAINILMRAPFIFFPHRKIFLNYPDGVHFQRGIQNMRVRDFQVEINIPKINNEIDYDFIQRIWWVGMDKAEKYKDLINVALEMRIFKGSEATLAPEIGYEYVCSIEILRTLALNETQEQNWKRVIVETFEAWKALKDGKGNQMTIRPHWGKEWDFIDQVKGHIFKDEKMKQQIRKFVKDYKEIGNVHNFDPKKNLSTFSNKLYKEMINNAVDPADKIE